MSVAPPVDPVLEASTSSRETVLILGATGMLGRALQRNLRESFRVIATTREEVVVKSGDPNLQWYRTCPLGIDNLPWLASLLATHRPHTVINTIGHPPRHGEFDEEDGRIANTIFPHQLRAACRRHGAFCIHISTDGVFSGRRGRYREDDVADPIDAYGRSKLRGELVGPGALTLRTSFIGLDDRRRQGLLAWFLAQTGTIRGYQRVRWSGLTCPEVARVMRRIIERREHIEGIWHLSGSALSKYELLCLLRERFDRQDIAVIPCDATTCDRTLDSTRLRETLDWHPPTWSTLIDELVHEYQERTPCRP